MYRDVRTRVHVCTRDESLSVVLASSGHHRRRTVGMVGNDPVMTLTPRIASRYMVECAYACVCASVCELEPSLPAPPPPSVSLTVSSSRGYP